MSRTKGPNRLQNETSPYLQQHAENPVDWYPWGEEALTAAREHNRPIFLSIGYSACHWCHVMEHESFENADIAEVMNRHFINIKVDREERPDLDQIYMNAVLALSGRGGWPMSVFLTPDLKPFYGGTYWPPTARMGMPGFRDVLERVHEAWETRRDEVAVGADELSAAVARMSAPDGSPSPLSESLLTNGLSMLLQAADRTHGGFGGAPKFPHPMDLRLLLRLWRRFGNDEALEVACFALDKMADGGIYDHLGGGFHRYATDAGWLVPHFEKMLYDNALLASAYVEAFQATGREKYARVVRETLDYVLREMTRPGGGFYSTQDADSEGEEGKFFVWDEREIFDLLGERDAQAFSACYDVSAAGNWEGRNILNRVKTPSQVAEQFDIDEEELNGVLERCREKLFAARSERVAPGRDEKILVSWNGLMIAAMAQAARVIQEPKYAKAAAESAEFILKEMRSGGDRLLHSFKDGQARFNGYLDDYACLINGLVELYQATYEPEYVEQASRLAGRMIEQFHDESLGGFYYTANDHEPLIARTVDSQDNATPSGNGMAATALLKLGRLCGRPDLEEAAVKTLEMLSGQLARFPMAGGQSLTAVDFYLGPAYEIVLADEGNSSESQEILARMHARFLPNKVVLRKPQEWKEDALPEALKPVLQGKTAVDGAATVFLCERGTCRAPVRGKADVEALLDGLQ